MRRRTALLLAICGLAAPGLGPVALGYVLPGERLLEVMGSQRAPLPAVSAVAELAGADGEGSQSVRLELHPQAGLRATDAHGGRWVVRDGALLGGTGPRPRWLPDLALLGLTDERDLRRWLTAAGVDATRNELGRCDEADCFVLGGREALRQVWIDKDRLEFVRWVAGSDELRLEDYADWGGLRFPRRIEIRSRGDTLAVLTVIEAAPAPELVPADFSPEWVGAARRD